MSRTTDDPEPITDRFHEGSWSANLEHDRHADRDRLLDEAETAVEHTASGTHVNLVTHPDHGHPEDYLFAALDDRFGDRVDPEFVDRCGCGGYVTRVHVRD